MVIPCAFKAGVSGASAEGTGAWLVQAGASNGIMPITSAFTPSMDVKYYKRKDKCGCEN